MPKNTKSAALDEEEMLAILKPEDASKITNMDDMFIDYDIAGVIEIFKEADTDNSGGLDPDEFCSALKKIYKNVKVADLEKLHMKIDANCDGTVELSELLDFVNHRTELLETLDNKSQLFPNPAKVMPAGRKKIVRILCQPLENIDKNFDYSSEVARPYVKFQYLAVSADGLLRCWSHDMNDSFVTPLNNKEQQSVNLSNRPKIQVSDMVYIPELNQLAVSTSLREILFFSCSMTAAHIDLKYSLVEEEYSVTSMTYWSNQNVGIFAYGTEKGYLTVFISYNVKVNGLFYPEAFEKVSLRSYKTSYVSTLLKRRFQDFEAFRIPLFEDDCSDIRYFPELKSLAVCGKSSTTMVLVTLPSRSYGSSRKATKRYFKSTIQQRFFTCVAYSPWTEFLVTGGTDGCLRVWHPQNSTSCAEKKKEHTKPITHIAHNPVEKIFISVSEDKNIRVWSDGTWLCLQSFYIQDINNIPVSSMCYNTCNNELFLANTHLGRFLGSGTDVCQSMLMSHHMPLCTALYHELFEKVISVCQAGVVSVWDVFTGQTVMKFKVSPENCVGRTFISFDQSQRKLMVVTSDGKVSFWNFNNGKELDVHSISVPKEVTAAVCGNSRVFVAMKDSKVIYDLDTKEQNNRRLQHHLLKDISCMDLQESTLITASSDGNVVVWNADTAEVMYFMTNTCSRVLLAGKPEQGKITELSVKKIQSKIKDQSKETAKTETKIKPRILILKKRLEKKDKDMATMLFAANGYISAWAVIIRGGLIAKFRTVEDDGTDITCMSTNADETILLTGHSNGKVCLWDIQHFGFKANADDGPCEYVDGLQVALSPPPLLGSWQAHPTEVVSVLYVPAGDKIVTAGLDCFVKHWTNRGDCIGIYGKDKWDPNTTPLGPEMDTNLDTAGTEDPLMASLKLSLPPPLPRTTPIADPQDLRDRMKLALLCLSGQRTPESRILYKKLSKLQKKIKIVGVECADTKKECHQHLEDVRQLSQTAKEYVKHLKKPRPIPSFSSVISSIHVPPEAHTVQQESQHVGLQSDSQAVKQSQNQHAESTDLSPAKSKCTLPPITKDRRQRTSDVPQSSSQTESPHLSQTKSKGIPITPHPSDTQTPLRRPKLTPQRLPLPLLPDRYQHQRSTDVPQSSSLSESPHLSQTKSKDVLQKGPMTPHPPDTPTPLRRPKLTRLPLPILPDRYQHQRTTDVPQRSSQTASRDLLSQRPSGHTHLPPIAKAQHQCSTDVPQSSQSESPHLFQTKSKDVLQKGPMTPHPPDTPTPLRRPKLTPQRLPLPLLPDRYQHQRSTDVPQSSSQTASRDLLSQRPSGHTHLPPIAKAQHQCSTDVPQSSSHTESPHLSQTKSKGVLQKGPMMPHPPDTRTPLQRPKLTPQCLPLPLLPNMYQHQRTTDVPQNSRQLVLREKYTLKTDQEKNMTLRPRPPKKQPQIERPWRTSQRSRLEAKLN